MIVAAGRCSQALIVCMSTKRHEQIWTGIRAITLNMYSEGYDLTRNFAATCRLQWVPRGITLKNSWMVPTRGINDSP
jgi:hypothetical protein